jgi:hypothetical protein
MPNLKNQDLAFDESYPFSTTALNNLVNVDLLIGLFAFFLLYLSTVSFQTI